MHDGIGHMVHPPGRYTPPCPLCRYPPGQVPPRQVHPRAGTPPWAGTPPQAGTPRAGTPPGQVHPPGQAHPPRQVHPPWAGTHPPGSRKSILQLQKHIFHMFFLMFT